LTTDGCNATLTILRASGAQACGTMELRHLIDGIHFQHPLHESRNIRDELKKQWSQDRPGAGNHPREEGGNRRTLSKAPPLEAPIRSTRFLPISFIFFVAWRSSRPATCTADIRYLPMAREFSSLVSAMDWATRRRSLAAVEHPGHSLPYGSAGGSERAMERLRSDCIPILAGVLQSGNKKELRVLQGE